MIKFTFEDLKIAIDIIDACMDDWRPDYVVGIKRGGLVPAVMMSHYFDCPMETIDWQTRDGEVNHIPEIIRMIANSGSNVLIIDDINDTGKTFSQINEELGDYKNVKYCSIIDREQSRFRTDYTARVEYSEEWYEFEWEFKHDKRRADRMYTKDFTRQDSYA